MCITTRCPLNGQVCDDCLCADELPADGPDPEMFEGARVIEAGTFGL
jgi:hypothetical protein